MKAKVATKTHILDVAGNLFYRLGIRAVGIDTVVAKAGVAKTTLYDHFVSKEVLINAYLEQRDAMFWGYFDRAFEKHPDDPRQQFADVFAMFEGMLSDPDFIGCPFLSATAEFPELDQPGHQVALAHKRKLRSRFLALAERAGAGVPEQLADQLVLVVDGAFAARRVFRSDDSPAVQLRATAALLLESHLRP
jgi:AcrR family transcriptional regulator